MNHRLIAVALALAGVFSAPAIGAELISVTVNNYQMVRLSDEADVIMVANPSVADVVLVSPRQMFVLGRQPGETNIYILDDRGSEIMQASVVVVPRASREVSLQRGGQEVTLSCAPRCAEVPTPAGGSREAAAAARSAAQAQESSAEAESGG